MPIANPVLRGCHPDPSVCRVDDDFFMVTSTFSYHPGLPIHHSTDLQQWTLIGHVLVGDNWIPLDGFDQSDGVWAPTIRHHGGLFYVIFPVAANRRCVGNYVTTAADPRGPWSTPKLLEGEGIDPSLFFDDDGRAWFTAARDALAGDATGPGEIWMREFDPIRLELVGPTTILWHGAFKDAWIEAPHIFKHHGVYHLICAEGGTERNHSVTAAQATSITGPYVTDARSPLLTHRHLGQASAIHNVGHADLVETAHGDTWSLVLGVRPISEHHTLGREVFLVPVTWERSGPVFAPGVGKLDEPTEATDWPLDDAVDWLSLRGPIDATTTGSSVTLSASPTPLTENGRPAALMRRQDAHRVRFGCTIDTSEVDGQLVGVVAFQNADNHVALRIVRHGGVPLLRATHRLHGREDISDRPVAEGSVSLRIQTSENEYAVGIVDPDGVFEPLSSVAHAALSTETAGGFVGVMLGFTNQGDPTTPPVTFSDVVYERLAQRELSSR